MSEDITGLEIIEEPQRGNIGTAGLGVRFEPSCRDGEQITIEQLWPDGEAEPVYIKEHNLPDLIYQLMMIHMAVMEDSNANL